MQYYFDCQCSEPICVELFQAGTNVACPACGAAVQVPSSRALKEQSGDQHPLASPVERAAIALEQHEPPFTGQCQSCGNTQASMQQLAHFRFLIERYFDDDGGIKATAYSPITLVASGPTEEKWGTLTFPLLFCGPCFDQFQEQTTGWSLKALPAKIAEFVGLALLLGFLMLLCYALPLVGTPVAIFLFWRLNEWRTRKNVDPAVLSFVSRLRWIGDAVAREDEFVLELGTVSAVSDIT